MIWAISIFSFETSHFYVVIKCQISNRARKIIGEFDQSSKDTHERKNKEVLGYMDWGSEDTWQIINPKKRKTRIDILINDWREHSGIFESGRTSS